MELKTLGALPYTGTTDGEFMRTHYDNELCQQTTGQFGGLNISTFKYTNNNAYNQESNIYLFITIISSNVKHYSDQQFNEDL